MRYCMNLFSTSLVVFCNAWWTFSFSYIHFESIRRKHEDFLLDDVAAEKAIERAAKEVRDQIAKGAADCKLMNSYSN